MKAYNKYMDNISVSEALHHRFISCTANTKPVYPLTMIKQYATAFTCIAVILLGMLTVPQLLQNNMVLKPEGNPPISQPGTAKPVPDPAINYTLVFNKAAIQNSSKIAILGHFWHELTSDEVKKVFPGLTDTHRVMGTANFQSDASSAALFNIDAHTVSNDGLTTYIQITPGKAVVDYVLEGDIKTSDVLGTPVKAGYFETKPNSSGQINVIYFASFELSGLSYYAELSGGASESASLQKEFSSLIGLLIQGGTADISIFNNPIIPRLRNDKLDLNDAYADSDFGVYLPQNLPPGFAFESAVRFINQERNYLNALWAKGMDYIHWSVSLFKEDDKAQLTSVNDTQNYDLSLYPIPHSESVPRELWTIVDNPIFSIEDLTLKAVQARAYEVSDTGDTSGPRIRFSVLYGDILVEINAKGASPEAILGMLQQIHK